MENEYDQLLRIRIKMSEGKPLLKEEKQMWEQWINKPYIRNYPFITADKVRAMLDIENSQLPLDEFLQRIGLVEPVNEEEIKELESKVILLKKRAAKIWLVAGILIVAICITALMLFNNQRQPQQVNNESMQLVKVIAPVRTIQQLTLPDNTRVWLDAGSSLQYQKDFAGNTRKLELEGQAYFEVSKQVDKPFLVVTSQQTLQVLGTSFTVKANTNDKVTTTTVIEGKVKVLAGKQELVLNKGQQAIYQSHQFTIQPGENVENALAWKKGYFSFYGTYLTDIVHQLERWYGVKVEFVDGVIDNQFYVRSIARDKPITFVLQQMKNTENIDFEILEVPTKSGATIRIKKYKKSTH